MLVNEIHMGTLLQFKGKHYVVSEYNNKPILLEIQSRESRISQLEYSVGQLQKQLQNMCCSNPLHDRRNYD